MKAIEIVKTYDESDCTSVGWLFELRRRSDGEYFISATYRTRWQGSRNGVRWEADLGLYDKETALDAAQEHIDALCVDEQYGYGWPFNSAIDGRVDSFELTWVKSSNGHIVR